MANRGKEFPLTISLKSVDKGASSGLSKLQAQLQRVAGKASGFGKGFDSIGKGFKTIAGEIKSIAKGLGYLTGAATGAVYGFKKLNDEFDDLGDKAEEIGIGVDALAQLRYAAGQSGSEVDALDSSLASFNTKLGQAKAGTGRFAAFLKKVNPEFLKQIKGAKSSEEAVNLLADAMQKLEDPTKKAALAAAAGFDASLIPLLSQGSGGVKKLREEFAATAGSQVEAAEAAGKVDREWRKMGGSLQGVKAAIVGGVGPAFADLAKQAGEFLTAHRGEIAAWARDFGEKLPGRVQRLVEILSKVAEVFMSIARAIGFMIEKVGGAENAVKLLVGAFLGLKALKIGKGLFEIGQGVAGIASAAAGGGGGGKGMGALGKVVGAAGIAGVAAEGVAGMILSDQSNRMDSALRGSWITDDLAGLRKSGSENARKRLVSSLQHGGFVGKNGQFADTLANRQALAGGELPTGLFGMHGMAQQDDMISELNTALAGGSRKQLFGGLGEMLRPVLGAAGVGGKAAQATVTVDIKGAPRGTRVEVDPASTANVDATVGYQMGAVP